MKINKILIMSLFLSSLAYSDIREEFPSYRYIFTEFNVDEKFIDNQEFKNFVQTHKNDYRKRFVKAMSQGELLVPTMREMIYQREISPVILYISMVESEFDPHALSRTGAGGLWQFVPRTGQEMNLRITSSLDERFDPIKATDAAVKYLYRINGNLNNWSLTTMAYNCGNECVNQSIRRAGTRDLGVLSSSHNNYIRDETKKYIKKVLLMAMIGENYLFKNNDRLGEMMHNMNADKITPVQVRSGESLAQMASMLEMNRFYLEKINAHLKNGHAPYVNGYRINIPTSKVQLFRSRYASIMSPNSNSKYAQR
ncbi:lytic transglycosylase domain-containing protein [bacterium]|nr:lytic transglycosylase domain-containing protein [bacterium]MBU1959509.1 lytic transglycosylase domain-containing protein [bacterium]